MSPVVQKTRRYAFPASHVLASRALPAEENDRIFGKCANPNGHGHDYGVEVSVEGPIDPDHGEVASNTLLDEIFDDTIRSRYSHSFLNDLPQFALEVPTAENIAKAIFAELRIELAERSDARLAAVRVIETSNNDFVVRA